MTRDPVARGPDAAPAPIWPRRQLSVAVVVAVSYYLAVWVGFALTFPPYLASALWAPNAVLLAALMLTPARSWWVALAAGFAAHVMSGLQAGAAIWLILAWYVGNASEAVIAAALLRRVAVGPPWFSSFGRVAGFGFATFAATAVSTLIIAPFVLHGGGPAGYWGAWQMRLLSNLLAMLTVTPTIVMMASGARATCGE